MKNTNIIKLGLLILLSTGILQSRAQETYDKAIADKNQLRRLRLEVEKNPDIISKHKSYIDAMGILNEDLVAQYRVWVDKFPKSAVVPFIIGDTLSKVEQPSARPFLLAAIERDPKNARAYSRLAFDADRWGDEKGFSDNMKSANILEPTNPDYAYYYASSLYKFDMTRWRDEMTSVAYKFKAYQRGRQAMFFLADKAQNQFEKIYYLQLLRDDFDPKSSWYRVGMEVYFDILLQINPDKALVLANEMAARPQYVKEWTNYAAVAGLLIKSFGQLRKDPKAAFATLNEIQGLRKDLKFNKILPVLKSEALSRMGNNEDAYIYLIKYFSTSPSKEIITAIQNRGKLLGKDSLTCKNDIRDSLLKKAPLATDFQLKQYFVKGNLSLSAFRGRAVLLTYWFPGCGPCRAEFPYFERVIKNYDKDKVAYLAINIDKRQNEYVLPFLEKTKYSFIPLEEQDGRNKGTLDNGHSAPVNFIINKDGRIIFSRFKVEADTVDELKTMLDFANAD